jgi:hypothetical protein
MARLRCVVGSENVARIAPRWLTKSAKGVCLDASRAPEVQTAHGEEAHGVASLGAVLHELNLAVVAAAVAVPHLSFRVQLPRLGTACAFAKPSETPGAYSATDELSEAGEWGTHRERWKINEPTRVVYSR